MIFATLRLIFFPCKAWWVNNSPLVALSFPLLTLRTFDCHSVFKFFSERLLFSSPLPVFLNEAMPYINQRLWQIIEPSLNNVVHSCSQAVPNHAGLALTGSSATYPASSTLTTAGCWLTRCTLWPPRQDLEFMQHIHAHTPAFLCFHLTTETYCLY